MESPRGSALLVGVGGSGKQSLARLAAFISSLEVSQIQLRKGYGIPDLKVCYKYLKSTLIFKEQQYKHSFIKHNLKDADNFILQYSVLQNELSGLYLKAGLKNVGIMFLMTDAQVPNEHFLVLINDMLASGEVPDLFGDDDVENIIAGVRNEVSSTIRSKYGFLHISLKYVYNFFLL